MGSFGTLGATVSQSFLTIGFAFRGKYDGWDLVSDADSFQIANTHTIRFAAPSQLIFSVTGEGEAVAVPDDSTGAVSGGKRVSADFNVLGGRLQVWSSRVGNAYLDYTLNAEWYGPEEKGAAFPYPVVTFAYGVVTPSSALPTTGSGVYALASGSLPIKIDYATKVVTSSFFRSINGTAYNYEIVDGKIAPDGQRFTGRLVAPTATVEGTIEGIFTGPTGEELMMRIIYGKGDMFVFAARRN